MHDNVGKPERICMQNVDQVHAQDHHQNVTEPQASEYHIKKVHTCTTQEL